MDTSANHYLADLSGNFNDNDKIKESMVKALKAHNIPIIGEVDFKFEPQGYTLSILLAASHFYIHTYPEHNFAYCDCFTCGDFDPSLVVKEFVTLMNLNILKDTTISRSKT